MAPHWFDPTSHTYYLNGQPIVSVTQALTLGGVIDATWFTEAARARGLLVHRICELIDQRKPVSAEALRVDADPAVMGAVEAYRAFQWDHRTRWTYAEHGFFHATEIYGGRPDRVGVVDGELVIVELKTGAPADWHAYQTAGYQGLIPTGTRRVLYLGANGRYKYVRCRHASDYPRFRQALLDARALVEGGGVAI